MSDGQKVPLHHPLSPFIWDVFIISPGGACIYKRASRGYEWAINIISQASWLTMQLGPKDTNALTYNTPPRVSP